MTALAPQSSHPRHGGANVRFPPPGVFLLAIACAVGLEFTDRAMPIPLSPELRRPVALLTVLAGLAAVGSALILFVRTRQAPEPWKPTPEVILRGPYRFSRNPMYLGMLLLQVGAGLEFDSAWMVALAPLALVLVHYTAVLPEERYLTARFGDAYRQYLSRVPRYLWR